MANCSIALRNLSQNRLLLFHEFVINHSSMLQLVLHLSRVESRHGKFNCEFIHPLLQFSNVLVAAETLHKVHQLRPALLLDLERDLQRLVEEDGDLLEVGLEEFPRGQRRRADPHPPRRDGGPVPRDAVLVEGDGNRVADLLELGPRDLLRLEVPKDQMILRAARGEGVPQADELRPQRRRVELDLPRVRVELGRHDLEELRGHARDLVLVRAALERGEHGLVDLVLEAPLVLTEEDHAGPRTPEALVRRGGHDVAELEGTRLLLRRDETRDVRHVHEEEGAVVVRDLAELGVVPVPGVGGPAADDHRRLEQSGVPCELLVVDESRDRVDLVRERLEVDRGGRDGLPRPLLLRVGVKSVRQVPAGREVESHDPVVRVEQGRVDREVGGRPRVGLDVHPPLLRIETVRLERPRLAELLDLVDDLVPAVVPRVGQALGVLIGEGRPEALHDRPGREVLGRDELEGGVLSQLLLLDEVVHLGVMVGQGLEPGEFLHGRAWSVHGEISCSANATRLEARRKERGLNHHDIHTRCRVTLGAWAVMSLPLPSPPAPIEP
ncbi:hypothetical protein THAOC_14793 [Thalassiosira oceanica]|uniref:Uncharacterized protein n=1 Tax=Thalassiosira oceanica TaxID=159749 RepID=K0T1V4_THAOC|nr:hypothetical protein THAOC_14793 [Thalassiosira oceanica]|eukprot:EJK64467.1 hypothetical protein THAOC_14793 [Thalassiosira oceanica]